MEFITVIPILLRYSLNFYITRYVISAVASAITVAGIRYLKLRFIDELKYGVVKTRHRCLGAIMDPR